MTFKHLMPVLLAGALLLSTGAEAQTLPPVHTYNNLGTKSSFANACDGINGTWQTPNQPSVYAQAIANQFVATATGTLAYLDVPLSHISGQNGAIVSITTNYNAVI